MLPELRIFAGPNGSGKSTVTPFFGVIGTYMNADELAKYSGVTALEAAKFTDRWRTSCLLNRESFTSETILFTERKLRKARMNANLSQREVGGDFITEDDLLRLAAEFRIKREYIKGRGVTQEWLLSKIQENYYRLLNEAMQRLNIVG